MEQQLIYTYEKIKVILGKGIEPLESVKLVEAYRRYWKPEEVKVILLAESHVFTSENDRSIIIPSSPYLPDYPTEYARFVYCLGYGEKQLTKSHIHPNRDGTPQFWKIFFSCNNHVSSINDFGPILSQTSYEQRVHNKIELLKELKTRGIWLVDASIVALYKDGNKVPSMSSAIKASWQFYTREIVSAAKPEHVICVGKGVASLVENDLKKLFNKNYTVIPQPNARLSSEEHMTNFGLYGKICCR